MRKYDRHLVPAMRAHANEVSGDYRDECIAYALAAGLVPFASSDATDAEVERASRRARWERRKQKASR